MGALSPEERAKLRAVADMIPDLPELRQAQKCKVAISVLFHVLRVWKPIFEKAAPEQYTKICKWLAVVATGYAARAKRRREVEYALEKMENRLRPYLKKIGLPPERRAFLACAMLAAALTLMDDARATCPLYARTGAWRYACQTTDTLVTALMRAFPGCDERGTEIYFVSPPSSARSAPISCAASRSSWIGASRKAPAG